jgi:hypothetical protein
MRSKLKQPWTAHEDGVLLRLRADDKPFKLIAVRLRRTPKSVETRYRVLRAGLERTLDHNR